MPGSYTKDAYKPIYQHSTWKDEAKNFEMSFATAMYNDAKVKQSAQTALVRLATVLNAYYGGGGAVQEEKRDEKEDEIADAGALGQIAAEMIGEKDPMTEIPQIAATVDEPQSTDAAEYSDGGHDSEVSEEPFIPEKGEALFEDEDEPWIPEKGEVLFEDDGDAPDASPTTVAPKMDAPQAMTPRTMALPAMQPKTVGAEDDAIDSNLVTPTVTSAFLKDAPESAGQVGVSKNQDINTQNVKDIMGQSGNLREKMTMMYNASLLNGGTNPEDTSNSISFKRLVRDVTDNDVAGNKGLQGLNMTAIKDIQSKKKDVMDVSRLSKKFRTSTKRLLSSVFGLKARRNRDENEEAAKGLGYQYYKTNGIKLSKREKAFALTKTKDGGKKHHDLSWREGTAYLKVKQNSFWARAQAKKGRILTAGPSGTTARMLSSYKFLGATEQELLQFRLALMGWMITSQDHSMYEIFAGSHLVGVKGKENLSEAAEMYRTIDPLTVQEIRAAAVGGELPHERVYNTMLEQVAQARRHDQRANKVAKKKRNSGTLYSKAARDGSVQEKALNIYTTDAFKIINFGQVAGNHVAKWQMNHLFNSGEGAIQGGLENKDDEKYLTKSTKGQIFDALRVTNRIAGEALDEATPDGEKHKETYNGKVYRGTAVLPGSRKFKKAGNIITLRSLTSTSKLETPAKGFMDQSSKKPLFHGILLEIDTKGLAGVDIQYISRYKQEAEVLLPSGTELEVTVPETPIDGTSNSKVELKIAGAPDEPEKAEGQEGDEKATPIGLNQPDGIDDGAEGNGGEDEAAAALSHIISGSKLAELKAATEGKGAYMENNMAEHPDLHQWMQDQIERYGVSMVTNLAKYSQEKEVLAYLGIDFQHKTSEENCMLLANLYMNYSAMLGTLSISEPHSKLSIFGADLTSVIISAIGL